MDDIDPDRVLRAERACYAVWPALRQVDMDGWTLRFAGGHTNRANSVNVVGAAAGDAADKIAACEALYRAENLPTVFRLSTAMPEAGLERALDAAGYGAPFHASIVLHAALDEVAGASPRNVARRHDAGAVEGATLVEGRPDARWLAASAALAGLDARAGALRSRIVGAISVPAAFASVEVCGGVAAQAYGAVCGGLVCLNAVVTAPEHRGRGLAGRAVAAVLGWAVERHGAAGACLQVLADNPPALALYRRFGFREELSRYHYRVGSRA